MNEAYFQKIEHNNGNLKIFWIFLIKNIIQWPGRIYVLQNIYFQKKNLWKYFKYTECVPKGVFLKNGLKCSVHKICIIYIFLTFEVFWKMLISLQTILPVSAQRLKKHAYFHSLEYLFCQQVSHLHLPIFHWETPNPSLVNHHPAQNKLNSTTQKINTALASPY